MSADMSPYCSAHDEWLIMKLCMYVGYYTANNVSKFCGEPVTQLHFKNVKTNYLSFFSLSQSAGGSTIFRKPYARTVCNVTQLGLCLGWHGLISSLVMAMMISGGLVVCPAEMVSAASSHPPVRPCAISSSRCWGAGW